MKGIKRCGECAYYSMKKHKCTRGFTAGEASESFFTDCDLPDAELVKHGKWMGTVCTACGESDSLYFNHNFCPNCGARMDGVETKILYVCNPDKNVKCDKTSCYINGGECRLTDKEEFAKVNESGVPIQDKSQEWYEKMIKGW